MITRGDVFRQVFDDVRDSGSCVTWAGMYKSAKTPYPVDYTVVNTVTYNLFQALEHKFQHELLRPLINDLGWGWR